MQDNASPTREIAPDLFSLIDADSAGDEATNRRVRPDDNDIRAAIDRLRGGAPILSVGLGRLAAECGGGKAYLKQVRDAYAQALGEHPLGPPTDPAPSAPFATGIIIELSLNRLRKHPLNPRLLAEDDPELRALAESIRDNGQQVPIVVVADPERTGHFLIVDGSRRHQAMPLLHVEGRTDTIQAMVIEDADPMDFLVAHFTHARNWSDYERALFFVDACERSQATQALLAGRSGLSPSGFLKAMAPARLPSEMLERIVDRRAIRVSDADRALRNWKKNADAVRDSLAIVDGPLAARPLLDLCATAGRKRDKSAAAIKLPPAVSRLRTMARHALKAIGGGEIGSSEAVRLREIVAKLARVGMAGTAD